MSVELRVLEELLSRLGIEVRCEALDVSASSSPGGRCRLHARELVIVDRNAPLAEQVGVLLDVLAGLDLSAVWVPPAIRQEVERRASSRDKRGS